MRKYQPNKQRVVIAEKAPPDHGACQTESLVYKATVSADSSGPRPFIWMPEHYFKTRFRNHKMSIENPNYRSSTTLSKCIWDLKEKETNYEIIKLNGPGTQCTMPPLFATQETHTLCVFDRLPVVSWRRAKYKQMYGLKSTLTVSRWILK